MVRLRGRVLAHNIRKTEKRDWKSSNDKSAVGIFSHNEEFQKI